MHGPAALLLALPLTLTGFTFESATPASQGMSAAGLDALRVFSNQIYPDNGILVMRFDKVVLEAYSGGTTVTRQRAIYSATKSFGAALVVKAIADGLLTLSDPACGEPGMTVFHLASFSGGPKKGGSSQCNDLLFPIGTDWAYSDGSANRLAEEVSSVYPGVDLADLLETQILEPIGATNFGWYKSKSPRFSSGISMDTRGMALYGRLWLRGGDWDGNQILPSALVSQFTTAANPALKEDYGLLWWVNSEGPAVPFDRYRLNLNPFFPTNAPADAFLAVGCQYDLILVVPSLALIIARVGTSSGGCIDSFASGRTNASDNTRRLLELSMDAVLPCGNGQLEPGEQCDDGNLLAGDCCSATCSFEPSGSTCDATGCASAGTCDATGSCIRATAAPCDDGLFCNGQESCDELLGCQDGPPPVVDDGVACTIDVCHERSDVIVHVRDSGDCLDRDPCTADRCDRILGCVHEPIPQCTATEVDVLDDAGRALLATLMVLAGTLVLRSGRSSKAA